jgi:multidrug efflux pump subunit AcrB
MEAASRGTKEIALAVLATTLSLVAVFVPVAFMSGIVGQFFRQFGITIAAAVLLSLFVAFTLDPMLSSRFSKVRDHHAKRWLVPRLIEGFLNWVDRSYTRVLAWIVSEVDLAAESGALMASMSARRTAAAARPGSPRLTRWPRFAASTPTPAPPEVTPT